MKLLIAAIFIVLSSSVFSQTHKELTQESLNLGDIRGTQKIVLKITPNTPEKVKILFNYQYRFTSQEIDHVYVGPTGNLGFSTRNTYSEIYDSKQKVAIDIADSTVFSKSEDLFVVLDVSKPHKNTHWVKVDVSLLEDRKSVV